METGLKVAMFFYGIAMPSVTIILLLGVSSVVSRPVFANSKIADAAIRIFLCFWFCAGYIRLPKAKNYRLHPDIEWKKSDISLLENLYYSVLAILFGVGVSAVTWWTFNVFLPFLNETSLLIAVVNGIIFAIPLMLQNEIFKL